GWFFSATPRRQFGYNQADMPIPTSVRAAIVLAALGTLGTLAPAQTPAPTLAQQILKQLIDLNTTDAHGTTAAAAAMRQRLLDAGFAPQEVVLVGGNPNKQNMVARLKGTGRE